MSAASSEILRRAYPRVLARTLGVTRNLAAAEDAVQEAVVAALATWPERGVPDSPEAWLLTAATNKHRDRLRKGKWEAPEGEALETLAQMSPWARIALGTPDVVRGWKDELLRLVFACCHPCLSTGESAALCLATVVGLSTREIAAAFVTEPRSMEQRLTRARKRLREQGDPEGTTPEAAHERLPAALRVIYLLFNEGYWSSEQGAPIRAELCRLSLGLAHSLATVFPGEPEALGLLALLLLHDARRDARLGPDGRAVPLPEQDRTRWDRAAIEQASQLIEAASARGRRGPFQIEAAISAVHCSAACADATDWAEIAALYGLLELLTPTPAVRVNRAFAVARAQGPEAGLALLADDGVSHVERYPYVHLVRGTLLGELGRVQEAALSLREAVRVARNADERAQIETQLKALGRPSKEET